MAGASTLQQDWLAVLGCIVVLVSAAVVLDFTGRRRAERHPDPIYKAARLPNEKSPLKNLTIVTTLVVLVVWVTATASPGEGNGSPLPYFVAAAFLFVVMPQVFARRIVRRESRSS